MRDTEQCLAALAKANHSRFYRAEIKRRLKARELTWAEVEQMILAPPPPMATMKVSKFLPAFPWVGPVKCAKTLRKLRIEASTALGDLSEGQRRELASLVSTWRRFLL